MLGYVWLTQSSRALPLLWDLVSLTRGNSFRGQITQIKEQFGEGRVLSPVAGIVSTRLSRAGETVMAGSSVAEIYQAEEM
ncbi:hypothetical protein [Microvirga sp. VF16]|uniref:hypothetical protein n=1 Tax=Microvirga sp. VF16 TaxID=2807101 RepID=UPI00193EA76B|nr:hypothetical protein [Microvirga sp. VF16]QRM36137.1 hypothetical protein JO965_46155 [Microvirga sp. VF16]